MFSISPFKLERVMKKLHRFGNQGGDVVGISVNDDEYILYNPINDSFDFAKIIVGDTTGKKIIEIDSVSLEKPDFSYDFEDFLLLYKTIYYNDFFKTKYTRLNKALTFIFSHQIALYIAIFVFICIGPIIASVFNFGNTFGLVLSLITFVPGAILLFNLSRKDEEEDF